MTIPEQIDRTRAQLHATKPRTSRRAVLQSRLCELMIRQLRREVKANRAKATK